MLDLSNLRHHQRRMISGRIVIIIVVVVLIMFVRRFAAVSTTVDGESVSTKAFLKGRSKLSAHRVVKEEIYGRIDQS